MGVSYTPDTGEFRKGKTMDKTIGYFEDLNETQLLGEAWAYYLEFEKAKSKYNTQKKLLDRALSLLKEMLEKYELAFGKTPTNWDIYKFIEDLEAIRDIEGE